MIGIEAVAGYVPSGRIETLDRCEQFGVSEQFIREKTGMHALARRASDEDTSAMCIRAFHDLRDHVAVRTDHIDCLVVCTQNPDGHGLPHTSAVVHGALGLAPHCAAFDISLGCSGYVYSLSIIKAFMDANGLSCGLLFTADPYSKIIDPDDKDTALLFGDAATVTLLTRTPKWEISNFVFGSCGADRSALQIDDSGYLHMNGRAVFSFSATRVPTSIEQVLQRNDCRLEDVDCVLLHQGSRYIVETIRVRLGLDERRVPFLASGYGNTVSSSIPLALRTLDDGVRTVVISGFGVGLSWASGFLRRTGR